MTEGFKVEDIQQAFISDPSVEAKKGQRAQLRLDIYAGGRWAGPPASGEAQASRKEVRPGRQRTEFESPLHHQLTVHPYEVSPLFSLSFHSYKRGRMGFGTARTLPW